MASKQRVLVIANRTADSPDLIEALGRRLGKESTSFTLLVPAVPHGLSWATDMKAGWSAAITRAEAVSQRIRASGIALEEVIVGDPDPFAAAGDVLHVGSFAEVIVSTLPRGISSWLKLGLAARLSRAFEIPVTEVSAHPRRNHGRLRSARRTRVHMSPQPMAPGSPVGDRLE
jgi:hypothetical protein